MVLNIFSDDLKFVDLGVDLYERTAFDHKYVILTTNTELDISKLNYSELVSVICVKSEEYDKLLSTINCINYDGIVLNSLIRKPLKIFLFDCLRMKKNNLPKIAWGSFGSELYENIDYIYNYLGKYSKSIYYRQKILRRFIWLQRLINYKYGTRRLLGKVDYMMVYMTESAEYFRKISKLNLPDLWLTYYPIENLIGKKLLKEQVINEGNILIGNSGSIMNNHVEAFEILQKEEIGNKKIIVPLSYGDIEYRNMIINKGHEIFGDKFIPLTEFIPREEYNRIILSCSVVFMNHYRQQAMGNILTAIWLGSNVYMNNFTTSYKYLSRIGIKINSIQDLSFGESLINFKGADNLELERNREILMNELSLDKSVERINLSLSTLTSSR